MSSRKYQHASQCLIDAPHWHMAWNQGNRTLGNQHLRRAVINSEVIWVPRNFEQAEPTQEAFTHYVSWTPSLNAGALKHTQSIQLAYTAATRHVQHTFPIGAFQAATTFRPTEAHACLDGKRKITSQT
jgi:hypothetical protein